MAGDGKTKDGLSSTEYPRIAAAASNVGLTLEEQWKKVTSDIVSKSGAVKENKEKAGKKKAQITEGVLSVIKEIKDSKIKSATDGGFTHQEEWEKVTTEVLEKSGAIKEKEEEASKKKAEIKAGVLSVIKELEGKAQSKW